MKGGEGSGYYTEKAQVPPLVFVRLFRRISEDISQQDRKFLSILIHKQDANFQKSCPTASLIKFWFKITSVTNNLWNGWPVLRDVAEYTVLTRKSSTPLYFPTYSHIKLTLPKDLYPQNGGINPYILLLKVKKEAYIFRKMNVILLKDS